MQAKKLRLEQPTPQAAPSSARPTAPRTVSSKDALKDAVMKGLVRVVDQDGVKGSLPFVEGLNPVMPTAASSLSTEGYTAAEREVLRVSGWKPGDPLPDARLTAELLQEAIAEQEELLEKEPSGYSKRVESLKNRPPLQVPSPVDVSRLSPERQRQIADSLEQARLQAEEASRKQREASLSASMKISGKKEVWDDLDDDDKPASAKGETKQQQESASSSGAAGGAGLTPPIVCPHCDHSTLVNRFEPTDADKKSFVLAVLTGRPFRKEYSLMGGGLKATFASLSVEHAQMCFRQCAYELKRETIISQDEFVSQLMLYRMTLSLTELNVDGVPYDVGGSVADYLSSAAARTPDANPAAETPLPALLRALPAGLPVLAGEPVRRMLFIQFKEFSRLVEALIARADDPDFYVAAS